MIRSMIQNVMQKFFRLTLVVGLAVATALGDAEPVYAEPVSVPTLTPSELENYQFPSKPDIPPEIKDLNIGQIHLMDQQRRDIKDLLVRRLGIMSMKGNKQDLALLQQIVDRKLLRQDDTRGWQSLGVVLGDILAQDFSLHWVVYQDELGINKALRWRTTNNFVFPVTVFSKRVQFKEDINVAAIYAELGAEIERFKRLPM